MTRVKLGTPTEPGTILLPQDLMERLQLQAGDSVDVRETPHGLEILPPGRTGLTEDEAFQKVVREDAEVLRRLAE